MRSLFSLALFHSSALVYFSWLQGGRLFEAGVPADLDPPIIGPPGPNPLVDMDPPGPYPLADLDPPGPYPLADLDPPGPYPLADLDPFNKTE